MQGFSGKILPKGLEIFPENRRLDLAFPSNPGVTFAPRTEMTAWCGSLKGAKMEVNGSRGRLDRKLQKRNPWKQEAPNKKEHSRQRETGQTTCKEVWFYLSGQTCRGGQIKFSSRFACCGWRLVTFMDKRSYTAFRFRLKRTAKMKNHLKSRKSTSLA